MQIEELSGSTLAYIGDAVWSLRAREYLVNKGYGRANDLQKRSVKIVSAKAQASFWFTLEEEGFWHEDELEVFRRGRNFKSTSIPKNTDPQTYRVSTGFEAVIGYVHLKKDEKRVEEIWNRVRKLMEEEI
ncbi:MAG: Mini-ribonuclease 3 [Erysipelotrichaceae bacterium]|nr:Mini-ribonuclease 3 [Erysipelotrichaceae bacterium]